MMRRIIVLLILFLAFGFRLWHWNAGLSDICLMPAEEIWLNAPFQPTSLYAWNVTPQGALPNIRGQIDASGPITLSVSDRLLLRFSGVMAGMVLVALTLRLARRLGSQWGWLAGLLVAVAPPFVTADRWIVRFDLATLTVAMSLFLLTEQQLRRGWLGGLLARLQVLTALMLLLIAPPLWWLALGLILLQPRLDWRWATFVLFSGLVIIPGLRTPEHWLAAAASWDVGALAACIWAGMALALWRWPRLSGLQQGGMMITILLTASLTLVTELQRHTPSPAEWELIRWLHNRLPDDAIVRFDSDTWPLVDAVACPAGVDRRFQAQSMPVRFFDVRSLPEPDYVVTTQPDGVAGLPYTTSIAGQFSIGRSLNLANPVDIGFGDLISILSYQLITPEVRAGELVDIRLDYQFGPQITPDALAYAAFLHITEPNNPGEKWVNIADAFVEESGNTGSRRIILNHRIRVPLPIDIPAGTYDVLYGINQVYTGERLLWFGGDLLTLGQVRVIQP